MKKIIIFLILIFSLSLNATTWVPRQIQDYAESADIVAHIYITKGELLRGKYEDEMVGCGQKVEATIIESFKGKAEHVEFIVDGMLLDIGSEYIVYLENKKSKDTTRIMSTNSRALSRKQLQLKACKSFKIGYKANWLNISEFVRRWSKDKQVYERWVTPAYNIAIPDSSGLKFKKVELRSMEVDGELVEKQSWSAGDGIPKPDSFWMYTGAFDWAAYKKYMKSVIK